ncbi:MAG: S41 family peptidase, partial [Phycisphaerae bacterium]
VEKTAAEFRKVWKEAKFGTDAERIASARRIRKVEDQLSEELIDVEVLTTEKPWEAALSQAMLARDLYGNGDGFEKHDWYRDLVKYVDKLADDAIENKDWYAASRALASLEDLEPGNEAYSSKLDRVRRHVRVLRLYVENEKDTALEEGETWKDLVDGIDARMSRLAINRMHRHYVGELDYRKLVRGALMSVKVLAQTPEVRETFTGLQDKDEREEFVSAVDRQLESLKKKNRPDFLDLAFGLRAVMRASEESVNIPTEVLVMEYTDGYLGELDKFSSMIWPHDYKAFEKNTRGRFKGVGVQIGKEPGEPLKVVTPLAGSPAYKAGLRSNDVILKVDGTETKDLSVNKLVTLIMGEEGTKVTFLVKRRGRPKPFEVKITRAEIHVPTVKGWRREKSGGWDFLIDEDNSVAYVRLTQFTQDSYEDLDKTLKQLKEAGINSLVLDLRFNPGGLLSSAGHIASEFVDEGTIVSTKGRTVQPRELEASGEGEYLGGNLVVLVNGSSASAAEIVSGALQDHQRATIVGERTYGKGSVQNLIPIRYGRSQLKLTTAHYYLPKGRLLHKTPGAKTWGVDPNVVVQMTPQRMKRWLGLRRKTDLIQDIAPDELSQNLQEQYEEDVQLSSAVVLLKLVQLQSRQG